MSELSHQSDGPGFTDFTLAELQLLLLGLWMLGERGQVDPRLMPDYRGLLTRLHVAMHNAVARTVGGDG